MRRGRRLAIEVRVLGVPELIGEDGPIELRAAKQRQLLVALAINCGRARSADLLIEALWGDSPPPSAAKLLQVYVFQLRKVLPAPARIGRRHGGYVLELPDGALDADRFERLLDEGRAAAREGNPELAVSLFRRALGLWRGAAYGEHALEEPARLEAARLEELRITAIEERLEAELTLGRHAELLPELERLAASHPLRERLQAQTMLALYRCGRQAEALDHYAKTRTRLHDELGLEPGPELKELQRRVLRHDPALAAAPREAAAATALPSPPNRLLGRERELAQLRELLLRNDVRLLVLTGAGGSGKTRLALEAARSAAASFANGAVFVGLGPIRDPELVPAAIARALGVEEEAGRETTETLAGALSQRELLLLVDNAEHVRAAAPMFVELLSRAPRLTILVTSRVVLHLSGEHVYPVQPLAEDAATDLFSTRAKEAEPRFNPNADGEEAIRTICRRLDGLPLAVELAAGHTRVLSPVELAARLVRRLPLLTGGPRDLPARQQTLQATLAWSYDLLEDDAQRDLRRLAVFAGGCTLEAAETVCETPLARLSELVDHNLLARAPSADGSRFSMLETIREFALDRLAESGEQHDLARAHADYLLALAERAEKTGEAAYAAGWLERLDAERDNFRAAIRWALDAGEPQRALRTVTALTGLWTVRGAYREWREWLREALDAAPDAPATLRATALRDLAAATFLIGEHEEAAAISEHALELFRELGDTRAVASMLDRLAAPAAVMGDHHKARTLADESLRLFRELDDPHGAIYPLTKIAWDEWKRGDQAVGVAYAEEALALARESGDTWWQGGLLLQLAEMRRERGEHERASAAAHECVSLAHQLGDARTLIHGLAALALLAAEAGDATRAGRLWGAAKSLEERGESTISEETRANYHTAVGALSDTELDAGLAEGRAMTLDEAIASTPRPRAPARRSR
jgi:predicted ATPase/DNA-binding SARP family transcriptional activator